MEKAIDIKTLACEPYVWLEDGNALKNWSTDDEVLYNQQLRQASKLDFYKNAFDFIKSHSIDGDYFEFGSHKCRTFRMALTEARKKNLHSMGFLAFDSFEGLPENVLGNEHNTCYMAGLLSTGEEDFLNIVRNHNIYVDRVKTFKGFYEDSLTKELKSKLTDDGHVVSLATLDCSFYESFKCVFAFIEDFLQEGSIVYIDDFRASYRGHPNKGPAKAFHEFTKESSFSFEPFLDVGWFGKSFIANKK